MTTPAAQPPANLGTLAFGSGATVEFQDIDPQESGSIIEIFASTDQPGTLQIYRIDSDGITLIPHVPPISMLAVSTAGEETRIRLRSVGFDLRLKFTNTNATAGTATASFALIGLEGELQPTVTNPIA